MVSGRSGSAQVGQIAQHGSSRSGSWCHAAWASATPRRFGLGSVGWQFQVGGRLQRLFRVAGRDGHTSRPWSVPLRCQFGADGLGQAGRQRGRSRCRARPACRCGRRQPIRWCRMTSAATNSSRRGLPGRLAGRGAACRSVGSSAVRRRAAERAASTSSAVEPPAPRPAWRRPPAGRPRRRPFTAPTRASRALPAFEQAGMDGAGFAQRIAPNPELGRQVRFRWDPGPRDHSPDVI